MNLKPVKDILRKLGSLVVALIIAIWVWLRTQIYPWARQHPVVCTVVVMTIFYLWMSAAAERRREFRDWPTHEQVRHITAETKEKAEKAEAEKPKLPEDPEARAAVLAWDPQSEDTPASYKLPAKLSDKQTRRLIADLHCVSDFYSTRGDLHDSYSRIYEILQASQDDIYQRVESQQGFNYPELCYRWYEFIDAGNADNSFPLSFDWARTVYVNSRVDQIRFRIIGGQHTVGDVKFISEAIQNVINEYKQYEPRTRRAMQLRDWIIDESLLRQPVPPNMRQQLDEEAYIKYMAQRAQADVSELKKQLKTPLDKHPDLQAYVDQTYRKYHGNDGAPPRIAP